MKKSILLFLFVGIASFNCYSQLEYRADGILRFGNPSHNKGYATNWEGWGHYLTYGSSFMQIKVSGAAPRIAGTLDQIVFYNSETLTFNSIQVASVLNYSDKEAKTNIAPINYGLHTVLQLKPVTYEWKNPNNGLKNLKTGVTPESIGFLSQDVEEILPQLVYTDSEGKKLLNYIGMIPILTKSIQELNAEIASLKAEITRLKGGAAK